MVVFDWIEILILCSYSLSVYSPLDVISFKRSHWTCVKKKWHFISEHTKLPMKECIEAVNFVLWGLRILHSTITSINNF